MDLVPPEEYVVLWSFTGRWSEEVKCLSVFPSQRPNM